MSNKVREFYEALQEKSCQEVSKIDNSNDTIIQVGSATCEDAAGSRLVELEFRKYIKASSRDDIKIHVVGCTGRCSCEPIVTIFSPGKGSVMYQRVDAEGAHQIFVSHILGNVPVESYLLDHGVSYQHSDKFSNECQQSKEQQQLATQEITKFFFSSYGNIPFYRFQSRIALRNAGIIDPLSIYEYVNHCGFAALEKVLTKNDPEWVIDQVTKSKLRGRGGGGFPTGRKWQFAHVQKEKTRYIICNADEGDPGAFMDRSMMESDPYSIIEGMIIGGFAIGAQKGFFYIRAEYPLAIKRIQYAIEVSRKHNLLGKDILGSGFDFDLEIRLGAGAFVCGEETALINSIEGKRGVPRLKPPFPAISGLWGKPTIINNVETLANLPVVIAVGGDKFKQIGTEKSGGTKVFALAGKVCRTGLVEVPMGTTIKKVVLGIGGGVPNNKKLKAVQTGGPAGGFIPESMIDAKIDAGATIDYETLEKQNSIMGSGGMIVLDEDDCMVDVAKFYLTFTKDESCGKCTPCREGTHRMLEILERITKGQGSLKDLDILERLAKLVKKTSLCGLGKAAPNPVLSALKHFREEFEAHVVEKRCPAKKCPSLLRYKINKDNCLGCAACARVCPANCISGERKQAYSINQEVCIKCGNCFAACRFNAVEKI